ncbi:uncharacterized protein [Montipora capricornis]|uniref:uncharacterized protein isoform X1 n=2 Tax=Montipora capricornis TaxID=246305 RepID=UPI0035F19751
MDECTSNDNALQAPVTSDSDEDNDEMGLEVLFKAEQDPQMLSFDMWGSCRPKNLQANLEENRKLKPLRVHILKLVIDYLDNINVNYFIYGGTALSVYREGGKMIEHDGDIDIAIFETDFARAVKNIDCLPAFQNGHVMMLHNCSLYQNDWFDADGNEILFTGSGGKRLKFVAARELLTLFEIGADVSFDLNLVHVDVFTLGQHPDHPNCFCVNWNIPGHYDYRKKAFPKSIFAPSKTYRFEGIEVNGMNDIKAYLEIEYGYLGLGAIYDSTTKLYVKIPEHLLKTLAFDVQQYFTSNSTCPDQSPRETEVME